MKPVTPEAIKDHEPTFVQQDVDRVVEKINTTLIQHKDWGVNHSYEIEIGDELECEASCTIREAVRIFTEAGWHIEISTYIDTTYTLSFRLKYVKPSER
jgi:hypothetical protein